MRKSGAGFHGVAAVGRKSVYHSDLNVQSAGRRISERDISERIREIGTGAQGNSLPIGIGADGRIGVRSVTLALIGDSIYRSGESPDLPMSRMLTMATTFPSGTLAMPSSPTCSPHRLAAARPPPRRHVYLSP